MLGSTERKVLYMPIQQTKKQSDLEKRLKLLRQQVYGRSSEELRKPHKPAAAEHQISAESGKMTYRSSDVPILSGTPSRSESLRSNMSYLHQDLLKILLLSSLAIGFQVILFILSKNHILNINFF